MELVETRRGSENATETQSLREALKKVVEQNPNGGEITLNEFCKMASHATRNECVRALKKSSAGVFITGRRGKESRFVYGPPALPFLTRMAQPQRQEHKQTPSEPRKERAEAPKSAPQFQLRIGIGSQITTIPLNMETPISIEFAVA